MRCSEVGLGTYDCAYNIMLPYYIRHLGDTPIKPEVKYIAVDKCLLREVLDLWERGIKTTGVCCGHGRATHAIISVRKDCVKAMVELGYTRHVNVYRPDDDTHFKPKTCLKYGEIQKGFSWWDEAELNEEAKK